MPCPLHLLLNQLETESQKLASFQCGVLTDQFEDEKSVKKMVQKLLLLQINLFLKLINIEMNILKEC